MIDAGHGLSVAIALGTFDPGEPTAGPGIHGSITRFREGDPGATQAAWHAAAVILEQVPELRGASHAAIAVPGHDGRASPALRALVAHLAAHAGWSVPEPDPLVRVDAVPEAKRRLPRDRSAELASLRWRGDTVAGHVTTIILVDDVLATGATLDACVAAMRRDGWHGAVRALVLARRA